MAGITIPEGTLAWKLARSLDSPELERLIDTVDGLRWTSRPGYPTRVLLEACLARHVYGMPNYRRTQQLIVENSSLQEAIGGCPSLHAIYRFTKKLSRHGLLGETGAALVETAVATGKQVGRHVAIDSTDLPAWANGQRTVSKGGPERTRFSDPDASWGHRSAISTRKSGRFYGYRFVHGRVCCDRPTAGVGDQTRPRRRHAVCTTTAQPAGCTRAGANFAARQQHKQRPGAHRAPSQDHPTPAAQRIERSSTNPETTDSNPVEGKKTMPETKWRA